MTEFALIVGSGFERLGFEVAVRSVAYHKGFS